MKYLKVFSKIGYKTRFMNVRHVTEIPPCDWLDHIREQTWSTWYKHLLRVTISFCFIFETWLGCLLFNVDLMFRIIKNHKNKEIQLFITRVRGIIVITKPSRYVLNSVYFRLMLNTY